MDGGIATPRKWDEDDDEDEEEMGVDDEETGVDDDSEVDEDESDSDGSSSDDSNSEEEPGGRKSSGMLRRAKGRYVPSPAAESRARVETDGGGGGGGGGLGAYRSFIVRVRVRIRVVVVQDQVWSVRGDAQTSRGRTAVSVSQARGETSRARGVARIRGGDRPFEFQICRKRRFESLGGECLEDALGTSRAGGGD